MTTGIILLIAAAVIVLSMFVPFLRSFVSVLLRIVILGGALFIAIAGAAMLTNDETIFAPPGWKARAVRFLTSDSAATSEKGLGDAACATDQHAPESKLAPQAAPTHAKANRQAMASNQPTPVPTPTAAPGEAEQEDAYDELVTHNYICEGDQPVAIPRARLLQMAQDTVAELDGWKLIDADQRTATLNCIYTTRIFGFQDDVKIVVTSKSDLAICSRSRLGEPDSTSLLRFFPGDFGANMGHIKQFYAAVQPKADQFCQDLLEKQQKKPKAAR